MVDTTLPVEHLFTLTCGTAPAIAVPDGPSGTRLLYAVTGGTVAGDRVRGTVVPSPGGDWVTVGADGTARIDVRLVLQPDEGPPILMTYTGVVGRGADGTIVVRTAPRFETGPGPHAWLNAVQAVGIGQVGDRVVTYEVYALV
jgi:hypothetical protein